MLCLGIDVSKETLSCAFDQKVRVFQNDLSGFNELLEWAGSAQAWCMEATGRYHELLARFAWEAGKRCLVVNPGRAKQYLSFVDSRAKTDRVDALSLARLAEREGENLRPYKPVEPRVQAARDMIVRRKALVEARVALEQVRSAAGDPEGRLGEAIDAIKDSQRKIEKDLSEKLKDFPAYERLMTIPGIGPLSSSLLVCTLERGEFLTSDSLVAFAGLDPRSRDSGAHRGQRRLSHQGDAQLRTVLYMAARSGARLETWKQYYTDQRNKGLSTTEATVILARKLLRVAWSIYKNEAPFHQKNGPALDKQT